MNILNALKFCFRLFLFGVWLTVGFVTVAVFMPEWLGLGGFDQICCGPMMADKGMKVELNTAKRSIGGMADDDSGGGMGREPGGVLSELDSDEYYDSEVENLLGEEDASAGLEDLLGSTVGGATSSSSGYGLSGTGRGGGGTGYGSIGIGHIGSIGKGSGAAPKRSGATAAAPMEVSEAADDSYESYSAEEEPTAEPPEEMEVEEMVVAGPAEGAPGPLDEPDDFDDLDLGDLDDMELGDLDDADLADVDESAAEGDSLADVDDEVLSDVDRKLANLPLGNIAFNTPETIPYGENARIELLVSLKEAEEQLREAVRAAGPVESARVKISDQMEARLTGLGFRIESITPERQAVTRGERTQWQWQIEPMKSDTLELHLTLSALIQVDGVPATRAVRTFERTILVDVPLVNRVAGFMADNKELLTTVVLLPIAGGVYRQVRKKRRKRAGPPPDDTAPPEDAQPPRVAA